MSENPLKLKRVHHVEFWVGNAKQSDYYYRNGLGFSRTAYAGLETGRRDVASYVLTQGKARLVVTTPLADTGPMHAHQQKHGDGVRDVAFEVESVDHAFETAVAAGAKPAVDPHDVKDAHGKVRLAAIQTYGDTVHTFLENQGYAGPFLPGYEARDVAGHDAGLLKIDHMVGNVELGKMDAWADFYRDVMGFYRFMSFDDKDISTEFTALQSVVMAQDQAGIKMPINEPADGKHKSQIEEYLDFYEGPGVQHIALLTADIIESVSKLHANGIEFLRVPDTYYDVLTDRVGEIDEDIDVLRELGVLVDRDDRGYLLQLFSTPVEDRPTLFFEIIERKGSQGFGKGNFRALFESIEREQAVRGNL